MQSRAKEPTLLVFCIPRDVVTVNPPGNGTHALNDILKPSPPFPFAPTTTTPHQVCSLVSLKRLSLACEVAVLLQDWDLVTRGVWRSYHLLLPLLRVSAMGHLLFQARVYGRNVKQS